VRSACGELVARRRWIALSLADVRRLALCWTGSPALERLLCAFGRPVLPRGELSTLLHWSANTLDTRFGAERVQAPPVAWPSALRAEITSSGCELGLLQTADPSARLYDATLILGGIVGSNEARIALARALSEDGVQIGDLMLLSAHRHLTSVETASLPSRQGEVEWQYLLSCAERAFGPFTTEEECQPGEHAGTLASRDGQSVRVLVSPRLSDGRRPSTADTVRYATECADLRGKSVLIVTTALYAPYQFFVSAPVLLAAGASRVELVGAPVDASDGDQPLAQRIAQEIHSGLFATAALLESTSP
jgi:hypothetical protein